MIALLNMDVLEIRFEINLQSFDIHNKEQTNKSRLSRNCWINTIKTNNRIFLPNQGSPVICSLFNIYTSQQTRLEK